MKNASVVLSSLALVVATVLFASCNNDKTHGTTGTTASTGGSSTGKIAYVDIDTLNAKYEFLRDKQAEFKKRQDAMDAEIQRSAQQLQTEAATFQQQAQAGKYSQSEGEAAQKRLVQMQQALETRKQSLEEQFLKETDDFNAIIRKRLDLFLSLYSKEKGYDYILINTKALGKTGNQIMYANKNLDVTDDVVKGMNEQAKKMSDTANGK